MYMAIIYYIINRDWAYNSNYTFNVLAQKLSTYKIDENIDFK